MSKTKTTPKKPKQFNVTLPAETQNNEIFKERTKYMSVSQYVNSLIDKDISRA